MNTNDLIALFERFSGEQIFNSSNEREIRRILTDNPGDIRVNHLEFAGIFDNQIIDVDRLVDIIRVAIFFDHRFPLILLEILALAKNNEARPDIIINLLAGLRLYIDSNLFDIKHTECIKLALNSLKDCAPARHNVGACLSSLERKIK